MNTLVEKNLSAAQLSTLHRVQPDDDVKTESVLSRVAHWLHLIKRWRFAAAAEGDDDVSSNKIVLNQTDIMCISDIPFVIPRALDECRRESSAGFERARLIIRRMDEYLVSPEDHDEAKRKRHADTSVGLHALAAAANAIQKVAFREVLSVDETLPSAARRPSDEQSPADTLFRRSEKIDAITDFQEAHDFDEFAAALAQHQQALLEKEVHKPSDMQYLKFCLMLEIQRDQSESCLRILLHDVIFKFHLSDFRLKCEIHVRKPIEKELFVERTVQDSHQTANYSAEFVVWAADWIAHQEVELYIVMKIESLALNKYMSSKFWDMAHLHVKNVPHGASRIFLREMTPVCRPHKILSRGVNVGQVEIEATYWSDKQQLSINIIKVSHSQAEKLLREPETCVEVVFQGPFAIYDIRRTKMAERSLNPTFNEEFFFHVPDKLAISDVTVDLILLEKSSLSHHPVVLGVLTLSKHTDWFPVRKFWAAVEDNPNVKCKDGFLFEGNVDD